MTSYWKYYTFPAFFCTAAVILYFIFAYHLVRVEFFKLFLIYGLLFLLFVLLLRNGAKYFNLLIFAGLIFRLIFLTAIPNLSQDFYRFIWDGELVLKSISPYLYRPDHLIHDPDFFIPNMQALYTGMGGLSASHYSNYPPLNQLFFTWASVCSDKITGMIISMRILMILADIGILYFGKKLLVELALPKHYILWYFLNPFIIIELTGNLHFEGLMLFLMIWSIYLLFKNRVYASAFLFACAVAVKLIPLLFLPLFIQRLGWKKSMIYGFIVILVNIVMFLPFLSDTFIAHYKETIGLWFTNFEFNASWYYGFREIGYKIKGYNMIKSYGKVIPWIVMGGVLVVAYFRKNKTPVALISAMLLTLSFYYFASTTVHPWYIVLLIGLSIFTNYRFPIVWSFVIMLSYAAYASVPFQESLWWIGTEYIVVYGVLLWEMIGKKPLFLREHLKV